jgi:hypothetical protein
VVARGHDFDIHAPGDGVGTDDDWGRSAADYFLLKLGNAGSGVDAPLQEEIRFIFRQPGHDLVVCK